MSTSDAEAQKVEDGMNLKRVWLSALVLTLLGVSAGRGEEPVGTWNGSGTPSLLTPLTTAAQPAENAAVAPAGSAPITTLPSWLTYTRAGCCGPVGLDGPIGTELFFRLGPSLPIAGGVFDHVLTTGWEIEGGGRVLFYNPQASAAWTVNGSISNIANNGQHSDIEITLHDIIVQKTSPTTGQSTGTRIPTALVTVESLNRTFVNAGLGRECWLMGSAYQKDCNMTWRAGIDGGGRYGSARVEFHELHRRTDTIFGAYLALHTDVEYPCGCGLLSAGFRLEWDYTWMSILQDPPNNSNLSDLNILFTAGIRW